MAITAALSTSAASESDYPNDTAMHATSSSRRRLSSSSYSHSVYPAPRSSSSSSSAKFTDKMVPLNDSTGSTSTSTSTTNAFHDLVAWFSRGVHPTATYTWTLHKGKLATLSGVESGSQQVDVVFCKPGDPLLQRLPDLGIPVLNAAWIASSMKAGKLLPIADFRLETSNRSMNVKNQLQGRKSTPLRREEIVVQPLDMQDDDIPQEMSQEMDEDLQTPDLAYSSSPREAFSPLLLPASSSPLPAAPYEVPPTPESLKSQDKHVSQAEYGRRGSVLSPVRASISTQTTHPDHVPLHKPQKFTCSGTCPELLCSHRPELAIPRPSTSTRRQQHVARFNNLTGFSPKLKRQSQYEVPRLSAQSLVHPQHSALPSTFSSRSKLNTRLAELKADLEVFKSPSAVKNESPSTSRLSLARYEPESRSSSVSARSDNGGASARRMEVRNHSTEENRVKDYRKKYAAPDLVSDEPEDGASTSSSVISRSLPRMTMQLPKEEDVDGYPKFPPTPISLKRKAEDQTFQSLIPSSPSRPVKRFKA